MLSGAVGGHLGQGKGHPPGLVKAGGRAANEGPVSVISEKTGTLVFRSCILLGFCYFEYIKLLFINEAVRSFSCRILLFL